MPGCCGKEARTEGLDLVLAEAKERLEFEFQYWRHLDGRYSILLTMTGLVLTVLISAITGNRHSDLNEAERILITGTVALLIAALAFFMWGFIRMRNVQSAPDPVTLLAEYLEKPVEETKRDVVDAVVYAWVQTNRLVQRKALLLKMGGAAFFAGIVLLGTLLLLQTFLWR